VPTTVSTRAALTNQPTVKAAKAHGTTSRSLGNGKAAAIPTAQRDRARPHRQQHRGRGGHPGDCR